MKVALPNLYAFLEYLSRTSNDYAVEMSGTVSGLHVRTANGKRSAMFSLSYSKFLPVSAYSVSSKCLTIWHKNHLAVATSSHNQKAFGLLSCGHGE